MQTVTNESRRLVEALTDVEVVLLTTLADEGRLVSRPMALQEIDADGTMWFFIGRSSAVADELQRNPQVSVAYADERKRYYVSVSGKARMVQDPTRVQELWREEFMTWFPLGITDPDLGLLRIEAQTAEWWQDGGHLHIAIHRWQRDPVINPG